jgi:hypothetical protein
LYAGTGVYLVYIGVSIVEYLYLGTFPYLYEYLYLVQHISFLYLSVSACICVYVYQGTVLVSRTGFLTWVRTL